MLIILSLLMGGSVGTLTAFYGLDHGWPLFKTSACFSLSLLARRTPKRCLWCAHRRNRRASR